MVLLVPVSSNGEERENPQYIWYLCLVMGRREKTYGMVGTLL